MGEVEKGSVVEPLQGPETGLVPEGNKSKQYIVAIAACLGAFAAGTVLAWTSPAGQILKQNSTDINPLGHAITEDEDGWIGSLMAIGALIGAFPTGILCDKIGRRWTILVLGGPFILSWVLITFANSVGILYAARLFAGISTGGACVAIPMYVAEIAEGSIRGTLGSFFQLLLTVGILFMYLVGSCVSYTVLGVVSGAAVIAFVVVFFFMPESPAYLLKNNKRSEAEDVLRTLRGPTYDVKPEIARLQEELDEAERNKASFSDLFSSRSNVNALIVGLLLMVFQQLSGINAVIFYTAGIFEAAGSTLSANVCTIIVGVVQVIATYAATVLVDRAGRKMLLLISSAVMCACLIVLGVYFNIKDSDPETATNIGWLPLLCVTLFIIAFSLGFGPLPWMMLGELFAPAIKSVAASIAVCLNWSMTFLVTKTFGLLVHSIGTAPTFWFYGGITAVGFIFVLLKVPETKGKTVQEIQRMLGGR